MQDETCVIKIRFFWVLPFFTDREVADCVHPPRSRTCRPRVRAATCVACDAAMPRGQYSPTRAASTEHATIRTLGHTSLKPARLTHRTRPRAAAPRGHFTRIVAGMHSERDDGPLRPRPCGEHATGRDLTTHTHTHTTHKTDPCSVDSRRVRSHVRLAG